MLDNRRQEQNNGCKTVQSHELRMGANRHGNQDHVCKRYMGPASTIEGIVQRKRETTFGGYLPTHMGSDGTFAFPSQKARKK